jgi:hypothetical protein
VRQNAADQVAASLRVEGATPSSAAQFIIEQWVHGKIETPEMERRIKELHGVP